MIRLLILTSWCSLLLAAWAAPAQTRASQPTTAPNASVPESFTLESAPEHLVYRLFFGELAASQKRADELEAQGKNVTMLRTRYQQLLSLNTRDYRTVQESAADAAAVMEGAGRQSADLIRTAASPEDRQRVLPQLTTLRQQSEAALAAGVERLRAHFGPDGFSRLDQRIRRHVVPHLQIVPLADGSLHAPAGVNR
jgi:hypothetical protein